MLKRYAAALSAEDGTYFFENKLVSSTGSTDTYSVKIKTYDGATVDVKVTAWVRSGVGNFKIDGNVKVLNDVTTYTATGSYIELTVAINGGTVVGQTMDATIKITRVVSAINKIIYPNSLSYHKTRV